MFMLIADALAVATTNSLKPKLYRLKIRKMSKVITITSGKGGVGKTTTAASFSYGLASLGHKTVVIDFDIGLRNLDIHLGCERRVIFDFVNVLQKGKI